MKRTAAAFLTGAALAAFIPAAKALGSSAEIVSFVSLLMAGLLPAMILTATVLRGDRFAATRIRTYGEALRRQLGFWAFLFITAIAAVFALTAAKMLDGLTPWPVTIRDLSFVLPGEGLKRAAVAVSFGSIAVILSRLWPAYKGLRSILDLNVQMAELQALANDRSLKDGLDQKEARLSGQPTPERADWS